MLGRSIVRLALAGLTLAGFVHAGCRTMVPAPTPSPEASASTAAPELDPSASTSAADPSSSAAPTTSASAAPSASMAASSAPAPDPKVEEEKYVALLHGSVSRVACASRKGVTLTMTLTVKNGLVEVAKALEPISGSASGQSRVLAFPALKGQAVPPLPSSIATLFDKPFTFPLGC